MLSINIIKTEKLNLETESPIIEIHKIFLL